MESFLFLSAYKSESIDIISSYCLVHYKANLEPARVILTTSLIDGFCSAFVKVVLALNEIGRTDGGKLKPWNNWDSYVSGWVEYFE